MPGDFRDDEELREDVVEETIGCRDLRGSGDGLDSCEAPLGQSRRQVSIQCVHVGGGVARVAQ